MSQLPLGDRRPDTARLSPCGTYRYELTRELGGDRPAVFCGLNPSKATAEIPDNTTDKDIGFARRWQCGRVVKVNAYAYRDTKPALMWRAARAGVDIVGPENFLWIRAAAELCVLTKGLFVVAWGRNIDCDHELLVWQEIVAAGVEPLCLGTNKDGSPTHELYIPYERELQPWRPR